MATPSEVIFSDENPAPAALLGWFTYAEIDAHPESRRLAALVEEAAEVAAQIAHDIENA